MGCDPYDYGPAGQVWKDGEWWMGGEWELSWTAPWLVLIEKFPEWSGTESTFVRDGIRHKAEYLEFPNGNHVYKITPLGNDVELREKEELAALLEAVADADPFEFYSWTPPPKITPVPVSDPFIKMIDEVEHSDRTFAITKDGKIRAVLVGFEKYQWLIETLARLDA